MVNEATPRAGELTTANYGWTKPTVGASVDAWGGYLNADLDSIDSTVKSVSNAIPIASSTTPVMDGTAAVGTGTTFARADHVHPTDTSRYAASNPSGYQTAAQVTAAVPVASSTTPVMDGTAAIGVGTTWARADHVHPSDTSRYAASNPSNYVNAAGAASAAPVQSVATRTGAVTLTHTDITDWTTTLAPYALTSALASYLPLSGGTLTGTLNGTSATFTGTASFGSTLTIETSLLVYYTGTLGAIFQQLNNATYLQLDLGGQFVYSGGTGIAVKTGGGTWTAPSDARIKTVEGDYKLGLDEVCKLAPVVYRYKGNDAPPDGVSPHATVAESGKPFVGLIAQAVETIMPGMVTKTTGYVDGAAVDDLRQLDTTELIFALVNAVKTLAARVDALEAAR